MATSKPRKPRAVIRRVTKGKRKGEFRFTLYGTNGEKVGTSHPETYEREAKAVKTLRKYFPNFVIYSTTLNGQEILY